MRSLVTVLVTSVMTLNMTMAQVHAEDLKEVQLQEVQVQQQQEQNDEAHVKVGERPMNKADKIAFKQKLMEIEADEKNGKKAEEPKAAKAGLLKSKANVSIEIGKDAKSPNALYEYSTSHMGAFQYIAGFSYSFDTIISGDGSNWLVYAGDRWITLGWYAGDPIVFMPNNNYFAITAYKIVNQRTDEAVEVDLIVGPLIPSWFQPNPYYHYIKSIDSLGYVKLDDGSYWSTSFSHSSSTKSWAVGDTVIIGVNNGALNLLYPNVLINVNMDNYAAGDCLY